MYFVPHDELISNENFKFIENKSNIYNYSEEYTQKNAQTINLFNFI